MPDYTAQFNQERALSKNSEKRAKIPGAIAQRMTDAVRDKESWVWPFAYALAIINDFGDILVIGSIPILGDSFDVFCVLTLTIFLWNIGGMIRWKIRIAIWVAGGIETILGIFILPEIMPFWILSILYAQYRISQQAKIADMGLADSKKGKINREAIAEFS